MKNNFVRFLLIFLLLISSISCKKKEHPFTNLSLDDCALWALSSQNETIQDAAAKEFSPLKLKYCNLFDILSDVIDKHLSGLTCEHSIDGIKELNSILHYQMNLKTKNLV